MKRLSRFLRRLWIRLTYLPVPCEVCNGTGICARQNAARPHSCCGDCKRKRVTQADVPPGFCDSPDERPLIGDGIMWRRPWSREQVERPDR
jgi:hypothetical protein